MVFCIFLGKRFGHYNILTLKKKFETNKNDFNWIKRKYIKLKQNHLLYLFNRCHHIFISNKLIKS